MDMQAVVDMKWTEALCRIEHRIEMAACDALKALGLRYSTEGVAAAYGRLRDVAPVYVRRIVVHGKTMRDMYDDHPGLGYYDVDDSRAYRAPAYCGLTRAKRIALEKFAALEVEREDQDADDGVFTPEYVVLEDRFGNALQEYRNGVGAMACATGWIEAFPGEAEWPVLLREAEALGYEAAQESGWDNVETARGLRARAEALKRLVKIAQAQSRLIP